MYFFRGSNLGDLWLFLSSLSRMLIISAAVFSATSLCEGQPIERRSSAERRLSKRGPLSSFPNNLTG